QQFMLVIIPISLAGIALLGVSAFYFTRIHIIKNIENTIKTFSREAASGVSVFFRQLENDMETLAETSLLADYYNNIDYGLKEEAEQYRRGLERYFLKFAGRTGVYLRIIYVDAKSRPVCAVENSKIVSAGNAAVNYDVFKAVSMLKKNRALRFPIVQDSAYGPKITYARPVFDSLGNFRGAIIADASLKSLQESMGRLRVGNTGKTYITDSSGRIVLSEAVLPEDRPFSHQNFSAVHPIEGADLKIMVAVSMSDFQSPLVSISRATVFLIIICAGLTALFIFFIIRKMTRPVKKLVDATRLLAEDEKFEKVDIASRNEIGELADSFNVMGARLMDRTEELKARINELTLLNRMSGKIIEKLEEDHICRLCLESAVSALGFERGTLYLINRERTHIQGKYFYSAHESEFSEEQIRERIIPLDSQDILAEVVRKKQALNVKHPLEDPRVNKRFIDEVDTKAFCLVPVMTKQKVIGVIGADNYYSRREIIEEQIENLVIFGNFMALALENAGLIAEVRNSEERYRSVLDNSPDAIIGLDDSWHITVWNRGAQSLFGYSAREILGRRVSRLFEPMAFEVIMRQVKENGFFTDTCVSGVNSLGKKLELDITWAGSAKWDDSKREWTVVIRDTSEQRKLQAQLIQAEKMSTAGRLISGVIHEINTPLSVIMGYSEMLKKNLSACLTPAQAEDVSAVYENARRCGEILRNMLFFVRESRKRKQTVSVPEIINSAVSLVQYRMKKSENISITSTIEKYVPPIIADYHQIEQILINLLQNARDALSQKQGERKIRLGACRSANSIYITVSDNGPGIQEDVRARLFEPFFTTKEEGQGTGLGLWISRRMAREHGGDIKLENASVQGTVFTVELPILKIDEEESAGAETFREPCPGKTILIVDDEPDMLAMMRRILESAGQKVETAQSSEEAVEKLKDAMHDLVICDVEMGSSKGFSVREAMMEMNHPAGFIFTTGNVLSHQLLEKLKESDVPFLPKPFTQAELFRVMEKALHGAFKRNETGKN
ncbi:MAG: response regulator, partial [Elusimicrobia bacterium]|nr:response regulator [Elusimicrobiota bacterium]